ncbi:hypothetical protein EG329_005221 [Mollisiaceae sp. DMI_Dod_QoI]|nr:hypothetical protein EG329_005221 [Helotiales sp. DMI_Dod_QoI]
MGDENKASKKPSPSSRAPAASKRQPTGLTSRPKAKANDPTILITNKDKTRPNQGSMSAPPEEPDQEERSYRATARHNEASKVPRTHRAEKSHFLIPDKTERTKLQLFGENDRTYVEGMVPKTGFQTQAVKLSSRRDQSARADQSFRPGQISRTGSTSRPNQKSGLIGLTEYENEEMIQKTYPNVTNMKKTTLPSGRKSMALSGLKSLYTTEQDRTMASRQTMINSMAPSEREEQELWATQTLRHTGVCPDSFTWNRISDGYHCNGEHHLITDELLAEGTGGVYLIGGDLETERWGPYYPSNPETPTLLWYAGPEPMPSAATEYIGEADEQGKEWLANRARSMRGMKSYLGGSSEAQGSSPYGIQSLREISEFGRLSRIMSRPGGSEYDNTGLSGRTDRPGRSQDLTFNWATLPSSDSSSSGKHK